MKREQILYPLIMGALLALAILWAAHLTVRAVWTENVELDTESRHRGQKGLAHRILLPKEFTKRNRHWDSQAFLLENGFPLKRVTSRYNAELLGKGNVDLTEKSAWISASDDTSPAENGRRYELRVHRVLPLWVSIAMGIGTAVLLVMAIRVKKRKILERSLGVTVVTFGLFGVFLCGNLFYDYLYDRPVKTSEPPSPWYGTMHVPNSDAEVWVDGAMGYYFFDEPQNALAYRPSVSLFYATLMKCHFDLSIIPKVFMVAFLGVFLVLLLGTCRPMQAILAWLLLVMAIAQWNYLQPLNSETLHMDFLSTALVILGVGLVGHGIYVGNRKWSVLPLVIGFFAIGVTCAIRGPHIFGAFLMLVWFFFLGKQKRWLVGVCCLAALLGPLFLDSHLREKHHVANNAKIALHGIAEFNGDANVYWDEAVIDYLEKEPETGEVISGYFSYFNTPEARAQFGQYFLDAVGYEVHVFKRDTVFGALMLAVLLAMLLGYVRSTESHDSGVPWWKREVSWLGLSVMSYVVLLRVIPFGGFVVAWCLGMLVLFFFALRKRYPITLLLIAMYLGGSALFVALGNLGEHRVFTTFQWCSITALVSLVVEASVRGQVIAISTWRSRLVTGDAVALALGIVFLYVGNQFLPKRFSAEDLAKVAEGDHLLKLGSDKRVQRHYFWSPKGKAHFETDFGEIGEFFPVEDFPDILYTGSYYEPNRK